jgi:hypothetical protein
MKVRQAGKILLRKVYCINTVPQLLWHKFNTNLQPTSIIRKTLKQDSSLLPKFRNGMTATRKIPLIHSSNKS